MREFFLPVLVGLVVTLAWIALWSGVLRMMGYPGFGAGIFLSKMTSPERQERIKTLGKVRYYVFYGLLGSGLGFGLGMLACDLVDKASVNWTREAIRLAFFALIFGASRPSWREASGETVPYPPQY